MVAPVGVRADVPTYVYRCYDDAGVLLYVGCTNSPASRIEDHRETAWWGGRISRVRNTVFPDRRKALEMERGAIFAERPTCNVRGRWRKRDPREDWTAEDYLTLHAATVRASRVLLAGDSTSRTLRAIEAELHDRFGITPLLKWRAA